MSGDGARRPLQERNAAINLANKVKRRSGIVTRPTVPAKQARLDTAGAVPAPATRALAAPSTLPRQAPAATPRTSASSSGTSLATATNTTQRGTRIPTQHATGIPTSLSRPLSDRMVTGRATMMAGPTTSSTLRRMASTAAVAVRRPVDARSREIEDLKQKMEEMAADYERQAEELKSSHERQLEDKESQLEREKEHSATLQDRISDLKGQLSENREALKEKRSQVSELQAKADELREAANDARDALQRTRAELEQTTQELQRQRELNANLKEDVRTKDAKMRVLHNDVVDMRGQIRVAVRVRPFLPSETDSSMSHITFPGQRRIALDLGAGKNMTADLNHVFGPNYSQARIFQDVEELILSCLHGYNVAIIMYGQTGSGKTHTMRGGDGEDAGLIPRAVDFLFDAQDRLADLDWAFAFSASFYEVYNDECYDLLSEPARNKCEVRIGTGKTVVQGVTSVPLRNKHDMATVLARSDRNRSTAATKCNETSSRSHAIFGLSICGTNAATGAKVEAVLSLVDLAGSERQKESGVVGDRLKEMNFINNALSNLQKVIRSLIDKDAHVPYRNSKLTMLLQDSLGGGSSKSMVMVTLNPSLGTLTETRRTLEFAKDMKKTHIGAAKKNES